MNRFVYIVLSVTLIAILLGACQPPAPAPTEAPVSPTQPPPPPPTSAPTVEPIATLQQLQGRYLEAADVGYAYQVAVKTSEFGNGPLGFRNAGSQAEHQTADYLYKEMKKIGLQDVLKEEFPVDSWEFKGAEIKVLEPATESKVITASTYAVQGTPPEGIQGELIYVNKGTKDDYTDIDVTGKIVLLDVDMRADWWITYPALQAQYKGAAAVISTCSGGYAMINDDALNSQDFVGPVAIPTLNISRNDANYLKGLLEKGKVVVELKSDNVVKPGGISYNISGKIPGKSSDEYIIIGDHYDAHFKGFQDNASAVGITLAIAKGMIDAGYQPERTLIFILHGAEEWGAIDTRYDWSIGAWYHVFKLHPEWSGKALAYFNFEMPAYADGDASLILSTPELVNFVETYYSADAPKPEGIFPEGVKVNYPTFTWSDDFSYTIAGIPAMVTDFGSSGFMEKIYHSNFDTVDTYNEKAFDYNLKFFGSMVIALDQRPAVPLDFALQAARLKEAVNMDAYKLAGVDFEPLMDEIDTFEKLAAEKYSQVVKLNQLYTELIAAHNAGKGDQTALLKEVRAAGKTANRELLAAYKAFQDNLIRLSWWDEPIFGFEHPQTNIALLNEAVTKLEAGEAADVVDNVLWQIEDKWYYYAFEQQVIDHFRDQVLQQPDDRLFWGAGRIVGYLDIYPTVASILAKSATGAKDYTEEIEALQEALQSQYPLLEQMTQENTTGLKAVQEQLSKADLAAVIQKAEAAVK